MQRGFERLVAFKEQHGHCDVKVYRLIREDWTLARFIRTTRQEYKRGTLSKEWIAKLEAIGFVWDPQGQVWEARLRELLQFKTTHGHSNVPSKWPENQRLATWLSGLRRRQNEGKLSAERQRRLKEIGVGWL
jgi:hypothetical protein